MRPEMPERNSTRAAATMKHFGLALVTPCRGRTLWRDGVRVCTACMTIIFDMYGPLQPEVKPFKGKYSAECCAWDGILNL